MFGHFTSPFTNNLLLRQLSQPEFLNIKTKVIIASAIPSTTPQITSVGWCTVVKRKRNEEKRYSRKNSELFLAYDNYRCSGKRQLCPGGETVARSGICPFTVKSWGLPQTDGAADNIFMPNSPDSNPKVVRKAFITGALVF